MKVLHVVDAIDPSLGGGIAERTFQLALALHRAGASCTILCTDIGLGEKRQAELTNIDLVAVPVLVRRFLIPLISLGRIKTLVAAADIIHVTGHWSILGTLVCLQAQRLGKPYVYCPAGSLRIFGRSALLKQMYNWLVGQRIVLRASCCLSITELEKQQFSEYGVPDARIALLPNGVYLDPTKIARPQVFRDRYGLGDQKIMLFLGRMNSIKGPDLLLDAFASTPEIQHEVRLVFAGPHGPLSESLRAAVERAGLAEAVIFIGFLEGQNKQDALAAADLLVVPSRQEAMSLVALEAGLCATPVLLTDQCGFDEVEKIGGGLIVKADAQALAAGIRTMLKDPQSLHASGERLQELVLSRYTWDSLTQGALALYGDLIRNVKK